MDRQQQLQAVERWFCKRGYPAIAVWSVEEKKGGYLIEMSNPYCLVVVEVPDAEHSNADAAEVRIVGWHETLMQCPDQTMPAPPVSREQAIEAARGWYQEQGIAVERVWVETTDASVPPLLTISTVHRQPNAYLVHPINEVDGPLLVVDWHTGQVSPALQEGATR